MKKKEKQLKIFMISGFIILSVFQFMIPITDNGIESFTLVNKILDTNEVNEKKITNLPESSNNYAYEEGRIVIDDSMTFNTSESGNWTWTATKFDWCTGNGEWGSPYVIEDVYFDGGGDYGLTIRDSEDVYFEVKNCKSNASTGMGAAGIYLENASNGFISGNNCSLNWEGITLDDHCSNNTITENFVSNNLYEGIYIKDFCDNNTITENNASGNEYYGIYVVNNCNNNTVSGNNASYNCGTMRGTGIFFEDYCEKNIIYDNIVSHNEREGILLALGCENNTITRNVVSYNQYNGIAVCEGGFGNIISSNDANFNGIGIEFGGGQENSSIICNNASYNEIGIFLNIENHNNSIVGNIASNNDLYGINLTEDCDDNVIWMNYIEENALMQANSSFDSASNWDNGTIGNYWGDYGDSYPAATNVNGIWDWQYEIGTSVYNDTLPMANPGIPMISGSEPLNPMVGDTGAGITWTITDSTILDAIYTVYLDGVEIQKGTWVSGTDIEFIIDTSSAADYDYRIEYSDGTAWGKGTDEVSVSVADVPKPVITTQSQTIKYDNITISWNAITGVDGYRVHVNGVLNESISNPAINQQKIMLWGNGTYSITISAINGAEESELSDVIIIKVGITPETTENGENPWELLLTVGAPIGIGVLFVAAFVILKKMGKLPITPKG